MPRYFYSAKSFNGEVKSGFLEAKDETDLARSLRKEGYILISAKGEESKKTASFNISLPFLKGVPLPEKMMFTRNLQVMVKAGISLPRAIRILAGQTKNKTFASALSSVSEKINTGQSLSVSLGEFRNIFSELFISMIKVGEESGTLEDVLRTLHRQMEREHELKSRIKGAMIYPSVILAVMIGIGILMMVMVVPKLSETFADLGVELPATTKMIMAMGKFAESYWPFIVLFLVGLVMALVRFSKTKTGKLVIDTISLRAPLISPIAIKANAAQMTRTLSSLIVAGVPIVNALLISADSLGNIHFQKATRLVAEKVSKGAKISEAMATYQNVYPTMIIQMVEVGEETGQTSEVLGNLAEFYEEEVSSATKNLSSVIEPVLMLVIGIAVGFFAISMLQPMYSVLGNL